MKWSFLLLPWTLFAAYVGNPADPAIMTTGMFSVSYPFFKFTSGYIYDYTSDKVFETEQKNEDFPETSLRHFGFHSQLATFSLIILERLQFFGSVGGTKEMMKEQTISDMIFDLHSSYHFAWSSGVKAIIFQWGQLFFSGDFTYFAVPTSHNAYFRFITKVPLVETEKQKFFLNEWQTSLALSARIFFLSPYVGATYLHSRLQVESGNDIPSLHYKNEIPWGYFYGVTLSLTGRFHFNFERRVRDEFGYTFSTIAVF